MASNKKLTKVIHGRVVKACRQQDAVLFIDFEDGSIMRIKLQGPTDSVMVRNAKEELEYAD